jgi:hypothetical protein
VPKLYLVCCETSIDLLVIAETLEEALRLSREKYARQTTMMMGSGEFDWSADLYYEIKSADQIPGDWAGCTVAHEGKESITPEQFFQGK